MILLHLSSYWVIEGLLRLILGLLSSFRVICKMGQMGGMGWDGMVIIGHRSSKSTFGAKNISGEKRYKLQPGKSWL